MVVGSALFFPLLFPQGLGIPNRPRQVSAKAKAVSSESFELDGSPPKGHLSLDSVLERDFGSWSGAEKDISEPLRLNPNNARVLTESMASTAWPSRLEISHCGGENKTCPKLDRSPHLNAFAIWHCALSAAGRMMRHSPSTVTCRPWCRDELPNSRRMALAL